MVFFALLRLRGEKSDSSNYEPTTLVYGLIASVCEFAREKELNRKGAKT